MLPIKTMLAAGAILISVTFAIYFAIDYLAKANDDNVLSATIGRTRAAGINSCQDRAITSPSDESGCIDKLEKDFTRAVIFLSIFIGASVSAALVALLLQVLGRKGLQKTTSTTTRTSAQ